MSDKQPYPVFVSGRQHSGNTVITTMICKMDGCLPTAGEGLFFSLRDRIDQIDDPAAKAVKLLYSMTKIREDVTEKLKPYLLDLAKQGDSAIAMYLKGMRYACEVSGNRWWVQKATHYIFFADEILQEIPDAKFIYMLRNTFDIMASRKNRHAERERLFGQSIGWNRGLRIANRIKQDSPQTLEFVQYENLVAEPEPTVRGLCAFLGADFGPELLQVKHVNASQKSYEERQKAIGFNRSRLYYYINTLTPAEIAAMDLMTDHKLLHKYYPSLPHYQQRPGLGAKIVGVLLVAISPFRFVIDKVLWARQHGMSVVGYFKKRMAAKA